VSLFSRPPLTSSLLQAASTNPRWAPPPCPKHCMGFTVFFKCAIVHRDPSLACVIPSLPSYKLTLIPRVVHQMSRSRFEARFLAYLCRFTLYSFPCLYTFPTSLCSFGHIRHVTVCQFTPYVLRAERFSFLFRTPQPACCFFCTLCRDTIPPALIFTPASKSYPLIPIMRPL